MTNRFMSFVKAFARDESGASLVEYSVLVGLITAALVTAITLLGTQIEDAFTAITTVLTNNQAGR